MLQANGAISQHFRAICFIGMNQQNQPPKGVPVEAPIHGLVGANIALMEDLHFLLHLNSGGLHRIYLLSPAHAKRLYMLFRSKVEEYEKQYGQIHTLLPDPKKNRPEDIGLSTDQQPANE